MKSFPVTPEGYKELKKELLFLKTIKRNQIIKEISKAREYGDLSENAEYNAAKEAQSMLENKIKKLNLNLAKAKIIDPKKLKSSNITFGATVLIINIETKKKYTWSIVGDSEANPKESKLGINSPIAKALIGKKINQEVSISTPAGRRHYNILSIKF
jgi:transcription elongation factor GreA